MSKAIAAFTVAALAGSVFAQISYNTAGGIVSENFNSLGNVTSSSSVAWANNTTIPGFSLFRQPAAAPVAITSYFIDNGASNAGSFKSFGINTDTDRALGGVGSGGSYFGSPGNPALAGWIALSLTNNTGSALTEFAIGYTGEQWRNGGNTSTQTMVLEYGFGANFASVTTWTAPGAAFNFTSLQNTSTAAVLDGNLAANRTTGLGGTVTATWNPGDTLWVRWVENNDAGNDHGLAIDDVRFAAIPTPGAAALLAVGGLAATRRRRNG
jgi:hypothetical protein